MLALATALLAPGAEARSADTRVVVAVLPYGTTVEEIAADPELAPGIVSAGLGPVAVAQTFLDIGQGNRVNEKLYPRPLPKLFLRDGRVPERLWEDTVARAAEAPADVVPGLLASTLDDAGVPVAAEAASGLATLVAVDRGGTVRIADASECRAGCGRGFSVVRARLGDIRVLSASLDEDDLLIALAAGSRGEQQLLAAGISGGGFSGNLTSSSTRTDGVVLATDIAPTILAHLGIGVPDEMNGAEITSGSERDPGEVAELQAKLIERPSRVPVVLIPLGAWLAIAAAAALGGRGRAARVALEVLGLAVAIGPATLLVSAALDLGTLAASLVFGAGSVAFALVLRALVAAPASLAIAGGVTVLAYAIDVVAGSPLTSLSVLGPNPGGGVRFFGIGNELEAILTTLTLVGTGAALSARGVVGGRRAAAGFAIAALLATAAFAPGRFGADVGAAIVLGVGGATAAVLALGLAPRRALLVVAGSCVAGLALLVAVDLLLGGAHLSRSVLGAGEAGDLVDVFERRLSLMVDTFTDPIYPELLVGAVAALALGIARWRVIAAWFSGRRAAWCGYLGALAGVLVGTVANDSGSVLLVIGMIFLTVAASYFWATAPSGDNRTRGGVVSG